MQCCYNTDIVIIVIGAGPDRTGPKDFYYHAAHKVVSQPRHRLCAMYVLPPDIVC